MPPVQSLKPKKSSSLDEWQWKIVENRFKEIKRQESKVRKRSGPPFVRKEGKGNAIAMKGKGKTFSMRMESLRMDAAMEPAKKGKEKSFTCDQCNKVNWSASSLFVPFSCDLVNLFKSFEQINKQFSSFPGVFYKGELGCTHPTSPRWGQSLWLPGMWQGINGRWIDDVHRFFIVFNNT